MSDPSESLKKDPPPPYTPFPVPAEVHEYGHNPPPATGFAPPPGYGPATGYAPAPVAGQAGYAPGYGPVTGQAAYGTTPIYVGQQLPQHTIIIGGCPACQSGLLEDNYSCLAIFCAIFFFPIGVLCCLAMRERRCTNCGATF